MTQDGITQGTEAAPDEQGAEPGQRRAEILDAAYRQFVRYGFRRTSMEDLAREADLSRASLYLHFKNKEEIFRCLAEDLHERAWQDIEAALSVDAPTEERIAAALVAKARPFLEISAGSEHARELYDEGGRLGPELGENLEKRFHGALADALRRADRAGEISLERAGLDADAASELLRFSSYGMKREGIRPDDFRRRVEQGVRVFFLAVSPERER